jgi:hypothetical protein
LPAAQKGLDRLFHREIPHTHDPVLLDRYLALALREACPKGTIAAMSFCAWRFGPASGGVIGSLEEPPSSAGEEVEEISGGVWCCAFPGGPGFAAAGSRRGALEIRQAISDCRNQHCPPWPEFQKWLLRRRIQSYLYVSDGSGGEGLLSAGGRNGSKTVFLRDLVNEEGGVNDSHFR